MRKIDKASEPPELTTWKKKNSDGVYSDLDQTKEGRMIRVTIREYLLREQFYLCAYCCQRIENVDTCHNEHIEAQKLNLKRSLDFTNIVASCNTPNQCGHAHQSQSLLLTPLMPECEIELRFKISGEVEGLSDRAKDTIQVLNLGSNNRALLEKRKQFSDTLLYKNGVNPHDGLEDEELLKMLISDLSQPQNGQLEPFAPVVINILQSWLQS